MTHVDNSDVIYIAACIYHSITMHFPYVNMFEFPKSLCFDCRGRPGTTFTTLPIWHGTPVEVSQVVWMPCWLMESWATFGDVMIWILYYHSHIFTDMIYPLEISHRYPTWAFIWKELPPFTTHIFGYPRFSWPAGVFVSRFGFLSASLGWCTQNIDASFFSEISREERTASCDFW